MSTPVFPLLNLAMGYPSSAPDSGCSDFAGQKLLPCAVTLQLPLYLSTKKWNFLGAFSLNGEKQGPHSRVLNFKYQLSLETASISAASTNDLSCQLPHLSQGQHSPHPDGWHLFPGTGAGSSTTDTDLSLPGPNHILHTKIPLPGPDSRFGSQ